ncbi:hypothetical protein Pan241w_02120 [Gimesia alba]|uniref:Uncharacterized protein n=1 Tax=Gimesia alba TaxID=2527973 RepID=A0A517R8E9_9PLAN|nr:hypothetical protein [Gimesia alba]QDT40156.1 hypothetical protein Pan241w_02120 [Gimesia alba]
MELTYTQLKIVEQLLSALAGEPSREFTYVTEWLGYLPFGQYHWIEVAGQDLSTTFPTEWQFSDLEALERAGHLCRVSEWQNPNDELHRRIIYEIRKI